MADSRLPKVGGDHIERSLDDFINACQVCIMREQEKLMPDNALIATLCDAVRLAREHAIIKSRLALRDIGDML